MNNSKMGNPHDNSNANRDFKGVWIQKEIHLKK
jgi:hypothetical protein